MSTHELFTEELTWAKITFSDSAEAQSALKDFQAERLELQRFLIDAGKDLDPDSAASVRERITTLKADEAELSDLLIDVAMADLFDF